MYPNILKEWGLETFHLTKQQSNLEKQEQTNESVPCYERKPILKLPLQFTFPPVEILSKQLTKLNSNYKERIVYLGPRWNDSFVWHKKFSKPNQSYTQESQIQQKNNGYYFNQRRVVKNNSFIHDSMRQNRFFKNEIYYRAFEGMNPTLQQNSQITFESRFESGNLDCVVKIDQNQYDLFLRIDTNTRGNIFWYYFKMFLPKNNSSKPIKNHETIKSLKNQTKKIKINICNFTKSKILYEKNLKPYVKRQINKQKRKLKESKIESEQPNDKNNDNSFENWIQGDGIPNCSFKQKRLRYKFIYDKIKCPKVYELSFEIQMRHDEQVSLAYCIPYTYSDLIAEIKMIQTQTKSRDIHDVYVNKLCESLTGVEVPIFTIGDLREIEDDKQKKIVFITGRIHPGESNGSLILSSMLRELCLKKRNRVLISRTIFVIIPMINPDGVIIGNGRCSALGRDLNRQFKTWNPNLNPQVVAIKRLIDKIQQTHEIEIYFDFHGHSRKKNVFFFGPNYTVIDPNYYRCRIFPKIFSKNLQFFRYYGCNYTIGEGKRTTARAIMINQFSIPFFYTVQTSIGFYYDYEKKQDIPLTADHYQKIGNKFKQSLKQYFEGIEEYEEYIKSRKRQKKEKLQQMTVSTKMINQKNSEFKNFQQKPHQLKYVKIFEEIKTQAKLAEKQKQEENSSDSDSCREEELLENEKRREFAVMLNTYNKIQEQKIQNSLNNSLLFENEEQNKLKHQKKPKKKHHSEVNEEINSLIKKLAAKTAQFRVHSNPTKHDFNNVSRTFSKSKQINNFTESIEKYSNQQKMQNQLVRRKVNNHKKMNQLNISAHNFFRSNELQFAQGEKVGIVNFSKMIQDSKSLRYSHQEVSHRVKSRAEKRRDLIRNIEEEKEKEKSSFIKNIQIFRQDRDTFQANQELNKNLNASLGIKPYPSSFYRIKYQTAHKKYRQQEADRTFANFKRSVDPNRVNSIKKGQTNNRLFINISKIQN